MDQRRSGRSGWSGKPRPVWWIGPALATCFFLLANGEPGSADRTTTRHLSFDDRVRHQIVIAQVYDSYLLGNSRPSDPDELHSLAMEQVRTYLKKNAALEKLWGLQINPAMLHAELERMAARTKAPDRLRALFSALGNDQAIIEECLVRPLLVERLIQDRFANDPTIHGATRARAEAIQDQLSGGHLDPEAPHPARSVTVFNDTNLHQSSGRVAPMTPIRLIRTPMGPETAWPQKAFGAWRRRFDLRLGAAYSLVGEPDKFVVTAALPAAGTGYRFASYVITKESFASWWERSERSFDANLEFETTATNGVLPVLSEASTGCVDDTWFSPLSVQGAPRSRWGHTMVWTGTHMIVWGGYDGLVYPMIGGRYDPTTDTWSTDLGNVPRGRSDHTAAWTGARMVIWGGNDPPFGVLNSGARYDPARNEWTPTSVVNAPTPRQGHTAIWTGEHMIVWGGSANSDDPSNSGGLYDPIADSWTATSLVEAPPARVFHRAAWTGKDMVVWGGREGGTWGGDPAFTSGGRYDPVNNVWRATSTSGAPSGRTDFSAVWTDRDFVVWGGSPEPAWPYGSGGRYDPDLDSWQPTSIVGAPYSRWVEPGVWTGSHMVIWGGYGGENENDGGRYDPIGDTWSPTSLVGAPTPRLGHRAVWTGNLMIVWGGFNRDTFEIVQDSGAYCGCAESTFFRDSDGDGWGDPLAAVRGCVPPAGHVPSSGDCDDSDATTWRAPGEVPDLQFVDDSLLQWSAVPDPGANAVVYDLIASPVPSRFTDIAWCVAADIPFTSHADAALPEPGSAFHYLVRGTNSCPGGEGTLGVTSNGIPRSGRTCP